MTETAGTQREGECMFGMFALCVFFGGCVCTEKEVEYAHAYKGSDNSAVWLWKFCSLFALERSVFDVWKGKKRQRERIKALRH